MMHIIVAPAWKVFKVDSGNTVYDSRENCNALIETKTNTLLTGCKNTIIPNSVTSIGNGAFEYCTGLENITIPDSVTNIGESAFGNTGYYNNKSNWKNGVLYIGNHLIKADADSVSESYSIKNGTITIADCAFCYCADLESIIIPSSVTSIGFLAFSECEGLESIKVDSSNTVYDSRENCNAIIETKTNTLITGCMNTIIPNSVTSIGDLAFNGCKNLTSITIPNSVTSIGNSAFEDCTALENISIPNSVTRIGAYAFYNTGYSGNKSNWENGVLYSGNHLIATVDTAIPESYSIKSGTITIAGYTFYHCTDLESITIPSTVTSIGFLAFSECEGLESIKVDSSNIAYDSRENCNAIIETNSNILIVGCKNTIIPNSVTSIGASAFYYCTGLESITIPNSVTSIGNDAFYYCTDLTDVYYSGTEDDRLKMNIGSDCEDFENATWHYYKHVDRLTKKYLINGNPTDRKMTYKYKSTVTFTAYVPEGGSIQWYKDNELVGTNESLTISTAKKSYTIKVVVTDKDGIKSFDTENVTIKTGFIDRTKAFFKLLFNKNAYTYEQK